MKINMELFNGRHALPQPVDGAVFSSEVDPTNLVQLEGISFNSIWSICDSKGFTETVIREDPDGREEYVRVISRGVHLNLYVSGLTVALIATLNQCRRENITVTLWHYNRETGEYYPQPVI